MQADACIEDRKWRLEEGGAPHYSVETLLLLEIGREPEYPKPGVSSLLGSCYFVAWY